MFEEVEVVIAERLDLFARRLYGSASGWVEQILDLNPGLSGEGFTLAAGAVLRVPKAEPVVASEEVVRLWT